MSSVIIYNFYSLFSKMFKRKNSRKYPKNIVPAKRVRSSCYFDDLPPEIIVHIFSFIPIAELSKNICLVCKKWKKMLATPSLWKTIEADREVPTKILSKWVRDSPLLQQIHLSNRNDTDEIVSTIGKYSRNLQYIKLVNCLGSKASVCIKSKNLCRLMRRCRKLDTIHFSGVKILSCKFFQLLTTRRAFGHKRKSCSYFGPVNGRQMKSLLESLSKSELYGSASIAAAKKKIFIDLDNQSLESFEDLWRDMVNYDQTVNEMNLVPAEDNQP
ncbi:hypothetical protein HHI36_012364 [Cryptolaemus montrouzieri]|uniref:F-box domain-containing protein n=1 Tax=Cryptolaemus montrouzieri TaxID=559131 RepID=A0ABD2NF87_9CUCU